MRPNNERALDGNQIRAFFPALWHEPILPVFDRIALSTTSLRLWGEPHFGEITTQNTPHP